MANPNHSKPIFPVILAVPAHERRLRGRDQVTFLSSYARYALALSADKSAVALETLGKDADGVPQPEKGVYWSLTHKPDYVGAIAARVPVGIDLERIRRCSEKLFKRVANTRERHLTEADPDELFFRYWTSKETVLKATGVGFKGISKCRVASVQNDHHLVVDYQDRQWPIEHCYFDGHIASVLRPNRPVEWTILDGALQPLAPELIGWPAGGHGLTPMG